MPTKAELLADVEHHHFGPMRSAEPEFSLISPTFKRPDEVRDFIASAAQLAGPKGRFEVLLADGTPDDSLRPEIQKAPAAAYGSGLPVSDARNTAAAAARAPWLIFLDSDCLLPEGYLDAVVQGLARDAWDAFGGPDAAPPDFSPLQKAISFAMTSVLTTGGIRGGSAKPTATYYPRGFNMGIRAEAFWSVGGYDTQFKCGEDVELSIRMREAGLRVGLIPEAVVWHKRRATLGQFFRQVRRFGSARIALAKRHKGQMKLTHAFPFAFMLAWIAALALHLSGLWTQPVYLFHGYFAAVLLLSSVQNRSVGVGLRSVAATAVMFAGYAVGFGAALMGKPYR
ncbi:MAG: glycosyltransferase family 2 protein [Schleiferiaceae bacterium]